MNQHTEKVLIVDVNIERTMVHLARGPRLRAMLIVGRTSEGHDVVAELSDDGRKGVLIRLATWVNPGALDRWLNHHPGWIVIPAPVVNVGEILQTGQNHHR